MDRKDLKIQALLETISQQAGQLAEFRVEITVLGAENERLLAEKAEREKGVSEEAAEPDDGN